MAEPVAPYLYAFKAGRAFRREATNFVDPSPEKGILSVRNEPDGLLHLYWANRESQQVDLDLIALPDDVSFVPVGPAAGTRVYVLKFTSSDQRHFFWLQDKVTTHDEQDVRNLTSLLADPDHVPDAQNTLTGAAPSPSSPLLIPSSMTDVQPQQQPIASSSNNSSGSLRHPLTAAQIAELSSLMASVTGAPSAGAAPDLSLIDVLTPQNLAPLFAPANAQVLQAIFPNLPPDLPTEPSPDVLRHVVQSPQFQAQVRNLDRALQTGLLGGLVVGLGLPEEAGTSVAAFLRAIGEQARSGNDGAEAHDGMDTD